MCAEGHALVIVQDHCYLHVLVAPWCMCGGRGGGCGGSAPRRSLAFLRAGGRKERES
jgi:hypothetical protein